MRAFADVLRSAYYFEAVRWAAWRELLTTHWIFFRPQAACTRGTVITALWKLNGGPQTMLRRDPRKAQEWAIREGILPAEESDQTAWNEKVSRGETLLYLYRAAGTPTVSGGNAFWDVPGDSLYEDAVTWAFQNELTNGTTFREFQPEEPCTRAQLVTFLYRSQM